ncbi:hypothetical protein [Streptomyces bluensis]|uniref:Uncharacterized protein n=1 Tax=Streptomyces bluensis TaxID=33897 RepID=A0ABW6UUK5_9ACTN
MSSTRTTTRKPVATKKAPAKKTSPRKTAAKKPTQPRNPLPTRPRPWMADTQGYATLAARIAGIPTPRIRDWHDHHDGTATRHLADGSLLTYTQNTRTLTWQTHCPMGAIHTYTLTSPSTSAAARVHADRCQTPHFDTSTVAPLTADELAELGIHVAATAPALPGDEPTESIPVVVPDRKPRALGDALTRARSATADTQGMSLTEITACLDQPKEHPQT